MSKCKLTIIWDQPRIDGEPQRAYMHEVAMMKIGMPTAPEEVFLTVLDDKGRRHKVAHYPIEEGSE